MANKVLITGGAGFIGCALARRLLPQGDEVVVFDNLHPQVHTTQGLPARLPPGARFVVGDVTHADNFHTLFRFFRPDIVVHLAAETGTGQSLTEANRHAAVNVTGTAQLVDALTAVRHVPKQMLLCSSRAVYGDGPWADADGTVFYPQGRTRKDLEASRWDFVGPSGRPARPVAQQAGVTHPAPISVYGATKLTQEHVLAAWCRAFGSALTVLRLQNVYGPGQAVGNPYTGVLTFFAKAARERQQLDVYEDGEIIRDFVHVEDVVSAIVGALAKAGEGVRTFDIGSGKPATIKQLAELIAARCNAPVPKVSGRFRDGDVRAAWCTIAAAQASIGYLPRISLEEGVDSLIEGVDASLAPPLSANMRESPPPG